MDSRDAEKNAGRFRGFADLYDRARPAMPAFPVQMIERYLGRTPETVIDLGCGTGLSTAAWKGRCRRAIGVEPSEDMLKRAQKKSDDTISFVQAYAHDTGLAEGCADAVVCSQSFHWMEPVSSLREIHRLLTDGGVFATVDCEWPPVTNWQAEYEYQKLYDKIKRYEADLPDVNASFVRYEKKNHLANIKESGLFRYCREIHFANAEGGTAQRLIDLLLSQGSLQTLWKLHPELIAQDLERFEKSLADRLGEAEFEIVFSYTMRIAVK